MKTAVKTILQGKDREYNPRFLQMSCHHLFEPVACTSGSGWEKGQVENQVGTGRGNFFTPLVKVTSFEELNVRLEAFCVLWAQKMFHPQYKTRKVFDVYEEERSSLIPYRGKFNSCKILCEVVSPYSLVLYDTNCYSVEVSYVGQPVDMLVYAWDMVIQHQGKTIARHKRSFERHCYVYNP
jgi:hypothetical protein